MESEPSPVAEFLTHFFQGTEHQVELRALPSKARLFTRDPKEIDRFINGHISKENIYFGCATREGYGGSKEHCREISAFWVDLDFKNTPEEPALVKLANFKVRPSVVVASGGGLHAYWLLKTPLLENDEQVEPVLRGLAQILGADSAAAQKARILRLPGTLNHKYDPPRKVELAISPVPWERRYLLEDFLPFKDPRPTHAASAPASADGRIVIGQRNAHLTSLAGSIRRRGMSQDAMLAALLTENSKRCEPPLPEKEVRAIAKSIGRKAPAAASARDFHPTDIGNAHRFVARHGQDLVFVPAWNAWCVYDGRRWRRDDLLEAQNRAKETVQSLYAEAAKLQEDTERKKLASFALASESAQRIGAMLQLARSDVAARAEEFDQDPDLLNCLNGTLHLPSGDLRPHRREDRLTKCVAFAYHAESQCPCWLNFLTEIMGGEKDAEDRASRMIAYLQRAIGYTLTGRTIEKAVFICHGSASNGKTTLLSVLLHVLEEYAVTIQIDSLMMGRFDRSNNAQADLADLNGARYAMTSESGEGQRLSEARLKRITQGMGKIRAVRKYENPISFQETHKLWLDANHRPRVKDDGAAIWNRLHLIPFDIVIPKTKQDPGLPEKLRTEAQGILAWAVQGARRWYAEGLQKPPEVEIATKYWQQESDVLETFLSERCIRDKSASVKKDRLYESYREWAEQAGEFVEAKRTLGRKLKDRGFDEMRRGAGGYDHWLGIGISDQTES